MVNQNFETTEDSMQLNSPEEVFSCETLAASGAIQTHDLCSLDQVLYIRHT